MRAAGLTRVAVVDAAGASSADATAIAAGTPSRALMQRAGAAAAAEVARRYRDRIAHGVLVVTGRGNNGGDGWVVARAFHDVGMRTRVFEAGVSATPDACAERALALESGVERTNAFDSGRELIVVDAVLGTGFRGDTALRDDVAVAIGKMVQAREQGAAIVALDVPSGLDASTGTCASGLRAHLTLTFGTLKQGHLLAREACGAIVVLDIGLGAAAGYPIATQEWFNALIPHIGASAHKGIRKKLAIVGGTRNMAGAVVLASRAALRSGIGVLRCIVHPDVVETIQMTVPESLTASWPKSDKDARRDISDWSDAVVIGPGLGREDARDIVERVMKTFDGPVVLDADALNAFENDLDALTALIRGRAVLLTPHPLEFSRLSGLPMDEVQARRFTAPAEIARRSGASVLLKGVPSVLASPAGETLVIAEGNPILATGGSGDVLSGIAGTFVAQTNDAFLAGGIAAFAHGRAASHVSSLDVRGYGMQDVLAALPAVWAEPVPTRLPPILLELPAIGRDS